MGPIHAATPTFDTWADDFAGQWVRLSPQFATRAQYFSGAEQDALDRVKLKAILQRHGLTLKWEDFERKYLEK